MFLKQGILIRLSFFKGRIRTVFAPINHYREKARSVLEELLPYKPRPQSCTAPARRLLQRALGQNNIVYDPVIESLVVTK